MKSPHPLVRTFRLVSFVALAASVAALVPAQQLTTSGQKTSVPGRLLVRFKPHVTTADRAAALATVGGQVQDSMAAIGVDVVSLPPVASIMNAKEALKGRSDVDFAEPDWMLPPDSIPNDPFYPSAWHHPVMGSPAAWDVTTGSASVIIAILDTGVNGSHPDLASKMVAGRNTFDGNNNTADVYGHGTAVAGCAAASSGNGVGVASIAWGCLIMPIRISDVNGYGYSSAIASGLIWAADHGARVANISYAVTNVATVTSAAQYFQSLGGVVTISSGNDAWFDASAENPAVLTVSATTTGDVLASFSNTGNNIDVAAPGTGIYTTTWTGGYGQFTGTSAAAPLVAGVAALVKSVNPALTASQVQDIIRQTAADLGPMGWDPQFGAGRVSAANAVAMAVLGGPADTIPPTVGIAAPVAGASVSGTATITVNATDNVGVASVSWTRDGVFMSTDTSAPFTFSWNTTGSSNGAHTITASAVDAMGNNASTQVVVTVANAVADTTPPAVSITSPAAGTHVTGNVSVAVSASDNVAVTKVELYVDGVKKKTSTTTPFTNVWKSANGTHLLQCKAYDAAGNTTWSSTVSVWK